MSVSNIPTILSQINLPNRVERINRIDNQINANNKEIIALKNQITAQKEVSAVARELITNNSESIGLTKEIIANKREIIANNEKLIGLHKEHRWLLQESRDLTLEAIKCVEKMIAIMMKNPAKYGGLDKNEFQQLPEVIETKKNLTEIVAIKSNQYPKEDRVSFMDTAEKVIDRSFYGININDLSLSKNIFSRLENNIDIAFAEKYTLIKGNYLLSPLKSYRIAQNVFYDFSNLRIKNFEI